MHSDIPSAFDGLLRMADEVDGEVVVFNPCDEIVYASGLFKNRYSFLSFNGRDTFNDLFNGIVRNGMSDAETLNVSPEEYFNMVLVSRKANHYLDFRKTYKNESGFANLLCHHRRFDQWSAQVRVDIERIMGRCGDYYTPLPDRVADAAASIGEAAALSALVDRLPIGVLVVTESGKLRWANAAAYDALRDGEPLTLADDGRLHHPDAATAARLTQAIATAAHAVRGSVTFHADGGSLVSVSSGVTPGTALVLLPPDASDDAVLECLRALGLTPAIAEVAFAVVNAGGPAEAALVIGKKPDTIKRQLARVYAAFGDSLGVRSQRALAHLVMQVAAVQARPGQSFHPYLPWGSAPQHAKESRHGLCY